MPGGFPFPVWARESLEPFSLSTTTTAVWMDRAGRRAVYARAQTYSTDRKTHLSWLLKGKRQKRGRRRAAAGAAMGVGTTLNGFVIYSCHPVYQSNNTHVVSRPVFWLGDAELLCARATIYSSPGVRTLGVVFMCVSVSERVCEFGARMSSRCKKSGSWPG